VIFISAFLSLGPAGPFGAWSIAPGRYADRPSVLGFRAG